MSNGTRVLIKANVHCAAIELTPARCNTVGMSGDGPVCNYSWVKYWRLKPLLQIYLYQFKLCCRSDEILSLRPGT